VDRATGSTLVFAAEPRAHVGQSHHETTFEYLAVEARNAHLERPGQRETLGGFRDGLRRRGATPDDPDIAVGDHRERLVAVEFASACSLLRTMRAISKAIAAVISPSPRARRRIMPNPSASRSCSFMEGSPMMRRRLAASPGCALGAKRAARLKIGAAPDPGVRSLSMDRAS
jgi:hypothetical protein